jgi:tetratricopeptide (TPR) repeat protein
MLDSLEAVSLVTGEMDLQAIAAVRVLDAEARMIAGLVDKFRARYGPALEHFRAARALFEAAGSERRAVKAMMREAFVLENAQRREEALVASRATLEIAQRLGYAKVEAAMWNNLGLVEAALGRVDEALEHQRRSLAVREEIGDRIGQAVALDGIGRALLAAGRLEEALEHHGLALALRETIDDRIGQGHSLTYIGHTLAALERREEALAHHRRAATVREATGDVAGEIASLENVATALRALGREAEASAPLERAAALAPALADAEAIARIASELEALPAHARKTTETPVTEPTPAPEAPPSDNEPAAIPWEARAVMRVEDWLTRRLTSR